MSACLRCAAGDKPTPFVVLGKTFWYHRVVVWERHGPLAVVAIRWVACGQGAAAVTEPLDTGGERVYNGRVRQTTVSE